MTDPGRRSWWEKSRGLLAVSLALAAMGCGSELSPVADEPAISSDGILVCGELPKVYPGATEAPHEWYSVTAMNNKLRHFPDFAAVAGVDSVSNCEQARAFFARYVEYNEEHPDFDRDEPLELPDLPRLPEPPSAPGEVSKIQNGTGDKLLPVVGITHSQGGCTGTFIAKNWVMTAAHCLKTAPGFVQGTSPVSAAKIHSWVSYTVSYAGPQGIVAGDVRTYPNTLQWMDPRYIGFTTIGGVSAFDLALLYFHQDYDGILPNNVPDATGSNVPYMRVSLSLAVNAASSAIWGFGGPDGSTLQRGNMNSYTITALMGNPTDGEVFTADVPTGSGIPYLCKGDSGGPIVDRYDIDPGTGVPQPQYVAVATWHGWTGGTETCATAGSKVFWVRTENERDFIGQTVKQYYPLFLCNEKQSASASGFPDYMECWGKPCKADTECAGGEFCMRPGSTLTSCTGCSSGGCDCIYGQCFEKPGK